MNNFTIEDFRSSIGFIQEAYVFWREAFVLFRLHSKANAGMLI
jgi:hypothetical protein